MPVSILDSSASNLTKQTAMQAYTHAMQTHTQSQVSSFDLIEYRNISDNNFDDIPTSWQSPRPIKPIAIFNSSAGNFSAYNPMEAYTHSMQAHVLSQMAFLKSCKTHGIESRASDDVPASSVLYQGPGPPIEVELEEAVAGHSANELTQI